jgi:hypothetical protein
MLDLVDSVQELGRLTPRQAYPRGFRAVPRCAPFPQQRNESRAPLSRCRDIDAVWMGEIQNI